MCLIGYLQVAKMINTILCAFKHKNKRWSERECMEEECHLREYRKKKIDAISGIQEARVE